MRRLKYFRKEDLALEDSISASALPRFETIEVSLDRYAAIIIGSIAIIFVLSVLGRIIFLASHEAIYIARAEDNMMQTKEIPAPRGIIYDTKGKVLAENEPSFLLYLDIDRFQDEAPSKQKETFDALLDVLGISEEEILDRVASFRAYHAYDEFLLAAGLTQDNIISLKSRGLESIFFRKGFRRSYPYGSVFAHVVGYTGAVTPEDLENNSELNLRDVVGKTGVEAVYDTALRGSTGAIVELQNAWGESLVKPKLEEPKIGKSLMLTLDADLQEYFYTRLQGGLEFLGRTQGVGIAMDPRSGAIRALVSIPSYDSNLFTHTGYTKEKAELLSSPLEPFFNRAISGMYSPGSTIKPLHALAGLQEGVIDATTKIFSPGYLEIPNPYNAEEPSRFLDWKAHGWVDMNAGIAQSSNVYFYIVGGGVPQRVPFETIIRGHERIRGLGISRLYDWWAKFGFGLKTGIDLPEEASGFLPTPALKEERTGTPWLLGDTYNVSIGQGDLLLTPLQIV